MVHLIKQLVLASYVAIAAASPMSRGSPLQAEQLDKPVDKRQFALPDLPDVVLSGEKSWQGIDWSLAKQTCSGDQFQLLLDVTHRAHKMTRYTDNHENSAGWNRYFWGPNPRADEGWMSTKETQAAYMNIQNNFLHVTKFPLLGSEGKAKKSKTKKLHYRCNDVDGYHKCRQERDSYFKDWTGMPAYTVRDNEYGWIIVFCPRYFYDDERARSIDDVVANPPSQKREKAMQYLYTYEHFMIHEWMHAFNFGYKEKIVDIEGTIGHGFDAVSRMYGDHKCHAFAWKYDDEGKPNVQVALNADTYAWFFTLNYFNSKLGWEWDGGSPLPWESVGEDPRSREVADEASEDNATRSVEDEDEDQDVTDPISPPTEPPRDWEASLEGEDTDFLMSEEELEKQVVWEIPMNVFMDDRTEEDGDPLVTINYIGDEYDDNKQAYDNKEDFQAYRSDCTLTWQCRFGDGHSMNKDCRCICDGTEVEGEFWKDNRCQGIAAGEDGK